jgi:thiol-disulfide isomerase/thioredoxin
MRPLPSLAAVLAVALLVAPSPTAARTKMAVGARALDFTRPSLAGRTVRLSSLRGHVVLLDFWATWCEPCKKELPLLSKLAPRWRQKGIEVVAVDVDDDAEAAKEFLRARDIHLVVVHDSNKKIANAYEPEKMPTSFAIDAAGVVRAINAGFEDGDEVKLEKQLVRLLATDEGAAD